MAIRFCKMLSVILPVCLLATGCSLTTRGTVTAGNAEANRAARCAGWPKGTFDAIKDTHQTQQWMLKYYKIGQKKRCWK